MDFKQVTEACNELDRKGQVYLDSLPFISNDESIDRIFNRARAIFTEANEDFDTVPEWVAQTMDYYIPYAIPGSSGGSIMAAMAHSITSQDAHLRNLLEIAEGRTSKELDFPVSVPWKAEEEK